VPRHPGSEPLDYIQTAAPNCNKNTRKTRFDLHKDLMDAGVHMLSVVEEVGEEGGQAHPGKV